jgi:hypothetical protein
VSPKERLGLGLAYLEQLTRWPHVMRSSAAVRGEVAVTLIAALAAERYANRRKALTVWISFLVLVLGLSLIAIDASIVAVRK